MTTYPLSKIIEEIDQLRAENEQLREVLESVEWEQGVCLFCGGFEPTYARDHSLKTSGHEFDCPRQVTLYGEDWKEKDD